MEKMPKLSVVQRLYKSCSTSGEMPLVHSSNTYREESCWLNNPTESVGKVRAYHEVRPVEEEASKSQLLLLARRQVLLPVPDVV
jgi:hypothetical protein